MAVGRKRSGKAVLLIALAVVIAVGGAVWAMGRGGSSGGSGSGSEGSSAP